MLINRRIEGFHEINYIYASHASLKDLAGHRQVNKHNELIDDTVIVADDRRSSVKSYGWRSSTRQNFAVTMAGSGLKSAQSKRLHIVQTNCHASTRG